MASGSTSTRECGNGLPSPRGRRLTQTVAAVRDAWNQLLIGQKRWSLYPGNPGGIPAAAGYNPSLPHLTWLRRVLPTLAADSRPLECNQQAGDILYVPSGWHHATINVGDTAGIALQVIPPLHSLLTLLGGRKPEPQEVPRGENEGRSSALLALLGVLACGSQEV